MKMKFKLVMPTVVDNPRITCPVCGLEFNAIDAWGCGEDSFWPKCNTECWEIIE